MSWISNLFSPRKRSASEADDGSEGILGSVLKRLKPEGPKKDSQASFEIKAEDDVSFNVDAETNIAGLVSSILTPRPLTLVAWKNKDGDLSIVPTSFCSIVSERPAYISIGLPEDSVPADTSATDVGRQKEFTVSIVSEWLSAQALRTLGTYELPEDEADLKTGLTTTGSEQVAVPRISEAVASIECKLHQKVEIKDSEGEVASIVVVAKVVCVHINKNVLTKSADGDDVADISKLKPVAALGNDLAGSVTQPFALPLISSPPLSPRSPEIRDTQAQLSPAAAETAEVVAHAVVDALTASTTVPHGNLEDARGELAETILEAVENALEAEENEGEAEEEEEDEEEEEEE